MPKPRIHVALALVYHADTWLVALRAPDVHLGGYWEFPGGKLHTDETVPEAALRELREECAVTAEALCELAVLEATYADRVVVLHPVVCRHVDGVAQPLSGTHCRWVATAALRELRMPEANAPIIDELLEWAAQNRG